MGEDSAQEIAKGGKKGLIKFLKLDGEGEWREWLQSDFVKPYWLELWGYLSQTGSNAQKRGAGLSRVQELMIRGEAKGSAKYSRRHVDKTMWDINDHIAYFLYSVRSENLSRRGGVFYQRNLHTSEMDAAIWVLKNVLVQMHSPSQIDKRSGGNALFGTCLPGEYSRNNLQKPFAAD